MELVPGCEGEGCSGQVRARATGDAGSVGAGARLDTRQHCRDSNGVGARGTVLRPVGAVLLLRCQHLSNSAPSTPPQLLTSCILLPGCARE
eukprot:784755-Rhodomonas_salina.1